MMGRGRERWSTAAAVSGRLSVLLASAAAVVALTYGCCLVSEVAAQPRWDGVAATTTGGELAQRLAVAYPGSQASEGQAAVTSTPWTTATVSLLPVPRLTLEPIPKGPWSTIVTGAVGDGAAQTRTPAGFKRIEETDKVAQVPGSEPAAPAAPAAPGDAAPPAAAPQAAQPKPLESLSPDATAVQQYCFNTAEPAADARFAWQAKKISEMEAELEKRVALLEAKTEEFKTWLARRDEFSKRAQDKLVTFYTRMRPDAAALQLAALDEETAAAVLMKIDAKAASPILSEMDPARAAKIAAIISGAGKLPRPKPPKPQAEGAAPVKPQADGGTAAPSGTPAENGGAPAQGRRS